MEFYYDRGFFRDFEEAKSVCVNAGGTLFEPRNATVTKAVSDHFDYFWLGIHNNTDNGTFVYESDGMPIGWTNWANGKPSTLSWETQYQTGKENCAAIHRGLWYIKSCGYLSGAHLSTKVCFRYY